MKLFLLDAFALIYRSFFALSKSPRINSKGQNTSAIFGFVNTLEEVLQKEKPTHIAIAFDPSGKTFRDDLYPEYKANRESSPEDIKFALPYIKKIAQAYQIPILEQEGFEADDVIGTIALQAQKEGFEVFMMTPDKDYGQLTSDRIKTIFKEKGPGAQFRILNQHDVAKKYGLKNASQLIDYLSLVGDSSDNVPGCPKIGPVTAKKLLNAYDSVEDIYDNIHQVTVVGKDAINNLVQHKDQVLLSKTLVTIRTDVPINFDADSLLRKEINFAELQSIFDELEFNSLAKRIIPLQKTTSTIPIQGDLFAENTPQDIDDSKYSNLRELRNTLHKYYILDNEYKIVKFLDVLMQQKSCAFDTETTNLDPLVANLVGISFCFEAHEAYYIPFPQDFEQAKKIVNLLSPFFENENIEKIGQNIKYDTLVLLKYGINIRGKIFDTMVAHYLLSPESRHNLDALAQSFLQYKTIPIESIIGAKGKKQKNMADIPTKDIYNYACEDADITFQLKTILEKEIEEKNFSNLFYNIEMPLTRVLTKMEAEGVHIDTSVLKELSNRLSNTLNDIEKRIEESAGMSFNINSPKQVGEILFDYLKLNDKAKKTRTGQYITSEETLIAIKDKHPIVDMILHYRGLKKLLSTYVDALPSLINPATNKVHTSYNQATTATGRLSSTNPNLQNIPIKDDLGKEIRKAFVSTENNLFLSVDYSQIELRIMAHLSQDPNMIKAFRENLDIHTDTASKIYKKELSEVTSDMRRKAKTANFGIIYGISTFGLAERLSIPRAEAKELINEYFITYPHIKEYMQKVVLQAQEQGYVETILGRKRFIPDILSQNAVVRGYAERNAVNAPIQGSAADIIKLAMVNIQKQIDDRALKTKMIMQVHDELNFIVPPHELEAIREIITYEMENVIPLSIPLKVEIGVGHNWLEAH